jgi:hypothetical protein
MIRKFAIGWVACAFVVAPLRVLAGDAPPPRPATPAVAQATFCPVAVYAVLPVPAAPQPTYAAFLQSPDGPGVVSGTLWINTATRAFHVRIDRRTAVSLAQTGPYEPVVFRLPDAEPPQSIFVDSLDTPEPGPCTMAGVWLAKTGNVLKRGVAEALAAALPAAGAPAPAEPIDAPQAACKSGNRAPAVVILRKPTAPPPGGFIPGTVTVLVRLGEDDSVLSASVERTPSLEDNAGALDTARRSVFRTGYVDCRPRISDYRLNVTF